MFRITVYKNFDPKQAKTFTGRTGESALNHLRAWMEKEHPDICHSFNSITSEPFGMLSYCESYKDYEWLESMDDDPDCFDDYAVGVDAFIEYCQTRGVEYY